MKKIDSRDRSSGFTLIEIGIIVPILITMVLILFQALFSMMRTSGVERGQIDVTYERRNAITNIESDIVLASSFLATIDSGLNDPYLPTSNGGVWSYRGDSATSRALVVRTFSTTKNPLDSSRLPAFIDDNDPVGAACTTANINFNDVQTHNTIYFVKNGNLFRRKLINKTTTLCSPGQYQKLSCPSQADLTAQGLGTRNATCDVDDELLATNVTNFSIKYYDDKTSSEIDVYAGGADPNLVATAQDIEVTLTLSRFASGQTVSSTSTLRMSKLNTVMEDD